MTVAFATSADFPALDPDSALVLPALAAAGIDARPARWDDPAENWGAYQLVVIRSTWDYAARRGEYLAWADGVPTLLNPAPVITWNTDKRYLAELAAAGVPVVPTSWLRPGAAITLPTSGEYVIKPVVSAGAQDSGRYRAGEQDAAAHAHAERLLAAGRDVMVQPYQHAVDTAGETAVLFFGGRFSHAITKDALLRGPDTGTWRLEQQISAAEPTAAQLALAEAALAAAPGGLLYARVDMVPGPDGEPLLLELELTEPSLFLGFSPGAPDRFAAAVAAALA